MSSDVAPESSIPRLLPSRGTMDGRVRELDGSRTSVGPVAEWPSALRTAVSR
jgi:hypothetical protein